MRQGEKKKKENILAEAFYKAINGQKTRKIFVSMGLLFSGISIYDVTILPFYIIQILFLLLQARLTYQDKQFAKFIYLCIHV